MQFPQSIWHMFRERLGDTALKAAYGPNWPRRVQPGEQLFEFYDDILVGWGSLLYEEPERVTWHSHGVFPDCQNQGLTREMSKWLRARAFNYTPCVAVGCKILDTNPRYQDWMRHKNPNKGWVYAGHISLPEPGYDVYMFSREYWSEHEQQA